MLRRLVWAQARTQRAREGNSGGRKRLFHFLPIICDIYVSIYAYAYTRIRTRMHACTHARRGREKGGGQKPFLSFLNP